MTRDQIYAGYTIDAAGIIQSPGKFQGEPAYAPYFHAFGQGSESLTWTSGDTTEIHTLTAPDRVMWPELSATHIAVALESDDQGFIYCVALSRLGLDSLMNDYEDDLATPDSVSAA